MPSFTFAAAAHAALWCGRTPLLCDIDPSTWAADPAAEAEMLSRYAGKIAVVMPYATFGYPIDLERYKETRCSAWRACRRGSARLRWALVTSTDTGSGLALPAASCFPCTPPSHLLWERRG